MFFLVIFGMIAVSYAVDKDTSQTGQIVAGAIAVVLALGAVVRYVMHGDEDL